MSDHAFVPSCRTLALVTLLIGLGSPVVAVAPARASETYGRLPLQFEANRGQTHEDVRFLARGAGYGLYLTAREPLLVLEPSNAGRRGRDADSTLASAAVLRMAIVGARPATVVRGVDELPGKANYFIGRDPTKWRTGVPVYAKVHYKEVYPGIDLLFYGNQGQLEYDFVVAPGADPKQIALGFEGAHRLEIDTEGDLMLHTAVGPIRQQQPIIYQEVDGVRREIAGSYILRAANQVGFQLAAYDRSRPLIIDPVLSYSTYVGGSGFDGARGIAVDSDGNAYVTGFTTSTNFPTTPGAFETAFHGPAGSLADAFVTKLNSSGSELVYSAYLGGSNLEEGSRIAVDVDGNAYVTGITHSTDFPITAGAFRSTTNGSGDAYVTKLNPTGSGLIYSTYLGGRGHEGGSDIAADALGNAYVTGSTNSLDFPTTPGAFQPVFAGGSSGSHSPGPSDGYVTKLNPTGSGLVYSTYLGGGGDDFGSGIAVDAGGSAYVTGRTDSFLFPTTPGAFQPLAVLTGTLSDYNAFVTRLHPTGSVLVYSTYLGGSGSDAAFGIAVDRDANAYVTGTTASPDFPTTVGALQTTCAGSSCGDAFVTRLHPTGSVLVYSTYLGGSGGESGNSIAVNASGHAYVTGRTNSTDFPTTSGSVQPGYAGGDSDVFVTRLTPTGSPLVYSTYLGGGFRDTGSGIAVDPDGNAYVTGVTTSTNFPTANAFQPAHAGGPPLFPIELLTDAFVAKIVDEAPPMPRVSAVPLSTALNVQSIGANARTGMYGPD